MDDRTERDKLLQVYLSDHLAKSTAEARLARRLADAERGGPDGPALGALADDLDDDRRQLAELVESLGFEQRKYKQALASAGELVGRLKLNGHLVRRSPLSPVLETEGLLMAVRGKLAAWETLRAVLGDRPGDAFEAAPWIARASAQSDTLRDLHRAAAARAFGVAAAAAS